jgi:hypothetical protein
MKETQEEICPYCHAYVTEIQPGDFSKPFMTNQVREYDDLNMHDWRCLGCGWLWSDASVQAATKEYYARIQEKKLRHVFNAKKGTEPMEKATSQIQYLQLAVNGIALDLSELMGAFQRLVEVVENMGPRTEKDCDKIADIKAMFDQKEFEEETPKCKKKSKT